MRQFKDVLKQLREEKNMSQKDLADALNVGYSTIGMYESGSRIPKKEILEAIADYFNVDMNFLYGKTLIRNSYREVNAEEVNGYFTIPVFGSLCCGNGGFTEDNIEEYTYVPSKMLRKGKEYFANYAKGNSMSGENINDGDLIIFEKTSMVDNGDIGCFCIDDNEAMCKRYKKDDRTNIIMLLPANDDYDPVIVTLENTNFRCIGKLALILIDRQNK